ncbi:hypothetical protein [Photobacterium leiognathi]|uniref:hypothetical protein n=1 Tax=Photobacterium leiognathi TaxID=553611 RepID=UPI0029824539|nr:hypothetical protein [Photobacterium leiognathi]
MNLDSFITQVITDIAKGVKDSQLEVGSLGGSVNPNDMDGFSGKEVSPLPQNISFDILVETSESNEDDLGGKVAIKVLSFGASHKTGDKYTHSQRIKFEVPVVLPSTSNPRLLK